MILELLDKKIKELKELQRLRIKKQNQEQQAVTDAKYKELIKTVSTYLSVYEYISKELSFNASSELKEMSKNLLIELKNAVSEELPNKETLNSAEKNYKNLSSKISKEWDTHYSALTTDITNSLKILGGIDAEKVKTCLTDIKGAEKWALDKNKFEKLKKAIDTANELIVSLKLQPPIIDFLAKMSQGHATFADIDETIAKWLSEEGLSQKIRLSFITR